MESNPESGNASGGSRKRQERKDSPSKRQARRENLERKARQQRMWVLGGIGVLALIIVVVLLLPAITGSSENVGEFTKISPVSYPNANGFTIGDPNNKVKVEIFEDFTCSACKTYAEQVEPDVIKAVVDSGLAYYVFYQFPFLDDARVQKDSDRSSNAALCAADQNMFWEYKQMLFANQTGIAGQFSDGRLLAFAEAIGLNKSDFSACYNNGDQLAVLNEHLALGDQMNVQGTPSVYVNGVEVSPGRVPTVQEILAAVQAAAGQ